MSSSIGSSSSTIPEARLPEAINLISNFVRLSASVIWEDLIAKKQPSAGTSLVDFFDQDVSYQRRVKIRDACRDYFLRHFPSITVLSPTESDPVKADAWYEKQKPGGWSEEEFLQIIRIAEHLVNSIAE